MFRSPLLVFLVAGVVLFGAYRGVQSLGGAGDDDDSIRVTRGDIDRMVATWEMQWRRPPTEQELEGMIDAYIREEVLYREALAMGLDENDTVIRRRLAQRMQLLTEDLATQTEPSEVELEAWFEERADAYRIPARVSFEHVYVSTDSRGADAEADARELLTELREVPDRAEPWLRGDRFMLEHELADKSQDEVARLFGSDFAGGVVALEPGSWEGPIPSGYGLHLVRVHERVDSRVPGLQEVWKSVLADYQSELRREANDAVYQELRARYQIEIENEPSSAPRYSADGPDEEASP